MTLQVFPGSIEVMFDLVEIKDFNLDVQAVASDLEIKVSVHMFTSKCLDSRSVFVSKKPS